MKVAITSTDVLNKEYSDQFDVERKKRMIVLEEDKEAVSRANMFDQQRKLSMTESYYKYGPARLNYATGRVDAFATAEECLYAFSKDHNLEHLLDATNYLMLRYMFPYPGEEFANSLNAGENTLVAYSGFPQGVLKTAEDFMLRFKREKNLEHLVNAANYLMLRFVYPEQGDFFRRTESEEAVKQVGTAINIEKGYHVFQ